MKSSRSILRFNLPTILTLSRILLIPPFIYVTPLNNFLGALIFSIASITDFFDGYLARKSGQITVVGIIGDPIADKALVIAALLLLLDMGRVDIVPAAIIIVREVLITALRFIALSRKIVIPAERGGKWKTGMQITAVICLTLGWGLHGVPVLDHLIMLFNWAGFDPYDMGIVALWISIVLGVTSGIQYCVNFARKGVVPEKAAS